MKEGDDEATNMDYISEGGASWATPATTTEERPTSSSSSIDSSSESATVTENDDIYCIFDEDDEDQVIQGDALQGRIEYVNAKQRLLERAAHHLFADVNQESYAAAQVQHDLHVAPDSYDSIWSDAKDTLRLLSQKMGGAEETVLGGECTTVATSMPVRRSNRKNAPNPRDPAISLATVKRVKADAYITPLLGTDLSFVSSWAPTLEPSSWMAQALVGTSHDDGHWKVLNDPRTCTMGLLRVPPPPLEQSIPEVEMDLQDAMALTHEARVVTQATPPFMIVHCNKAFLELAGLQDQKRIIGQPVERLIQVQDMQTLCGQLTVKIHKHERRTANCKLQVVPLTDRTSKRRKINDGFGHLCPVACLSHVLVKLQRNAAGSSDPTPAKQVATIVAADRSTSKPAARHVLPRPTSKTVIGTIG